MCNDQNLNNQLVGTGKIKVKVPDCQEVGTFVSKFRHLYKSGQFSKLRGDLSQEVPVRGWHKHFRVQ